MDYRRLMLTGLAVSALAACSPSKPASSTEAAAAPDSSAAPAPEAAPAPAAADADPAAQKLLATLPAPYASADLANGKRQFAKCRSCHSLAEGGPNMTGPHLYGVFGRKAGSVEGFAYSDALKAAGYAWDFARLDAWIKSPRTVHPGTKMAFVGITADKDRSDLIAYLATQTGYKPG